MKKIFLTLAVSTLLLIVTVASARQVGLSCDDMLKGIVNSHLSELRALDDVRQARPVFSKAGAILSEVSTEACPDHYGSLAEIACRGGKVLIAELQASPPYCSWSGSSPAKVSFHYNKQGTSAEVFTRLPKSILSDNIFSIFFENK